MATEQKPLTSIILVELDCLVDTRQGTLIRMDSDKAAELLINGYHDRPWDIFPGVDMDLYRTTYNHRDRDTLALSMVTPVGKLIKDFCDRTHQQTLKTPFHKQPKVCINIWPYTLEKEEITLIEESVSAIIQHVCEVEAIFKSPEDLNPAWLKEHIDIAVVYDPGKWLDTHSKNGLLKKYTCPKVIMMSPALLKKATEIVPKNINDLLEETEKLTAAFVGLQFLPVEMFSSVINPMRHKLLETPEGPQEPSVEGVSPS